MGNSEVTVDTAPWDAAMHELVTLALAANPPSEFVEVFRLACLSLFDSPNNLREVVAEGARQPQITGDPS